MITVTQVLFSGAVIIVTMICWVGVSPSHQKPLIFTVPVDKLHVILSLVIIGSQMCASR